MGAKGSRVVPYDEALKRVDDSELVSLQATFKRNFGPTLLMPKHVFVSGAFGEGTPQHIVERVFHVLGGTDRGIHFKDYLCGRVVFRCGTQPERIRFVFDVYDVNGTGGLSRDDLEVVLTSEGLSSADAASMLSRFSREEPKITFEQFAQWAEAYRSATCLIAWIYTPASAESKQTMAVPTIYETLASVSSFRPTDVQDLERSYYDLVTKSPSGRLDCATLAGELSPLIPEPVTRALFERMDENNDKALDFREFVRGFSECVAAPRERRLLYIFRALAKETGGVLSESLLCKLLEGVALIDAPDGSGAAEERKGDKEGGQGPEQAQSQSQPPEAAHDHVHGHMQGQKRQRRRAPSIADAAASCVRTYGADGTLNEGGFLAWCEAFGAAAAQQKSDVPPLSLARLADALWEVAHVTLGLRPQKASAEGSLIRGWIARERMRTPCEGDVWHPVALSWWNTWAAYVDAERKGAQRQSFSQQQQQQPGHLAQGHVIPATVADDLTPPPIDNAALAAPETKGGGIPLLTECGNRLRPQLIENTDYVVVPEKVWNALVGWYGGGPAMPRRFVPMPHQLNSSKHGKSVVPLELEMYPLVLSVFRHTPTPANGVSASPDGPKRFLAYNAIHTRRATVRSLTAFIVTQQRRAVGGVMGLNLDDARLYLVRDDASPPRLLHDEEMRLEDAGIVDGSKLLLEMRSQDLTWPEEMHALARKEQLKRDREAAAAKAAAKREKDARKGKGVASGTLSLSGTASGNVSGVAILTDDSAPMTPLAGVSTEALDAGTVIVNGEIGLTGLSNLGNTCFMNSALQCLSNTSPLREYFLSRCHSFEYNLTNKLGMKGHIAKLYGELLREIWSGRARSIAPLKLRAAIGKYASRFDSYQQQDSQELLAFLLDGLHEDLNRVTEKPYTELRDADGRSDEQVSLEWWENHLRRNRSIVVDLFHGQLRSQLTCCTCGHRSATFDPFTFLTVPLPLETHSFHEVVVFDVCEARPVRYGLRLPMTSTIGELRDALSALCGIPADQLVIAEVWGPWATTYLGRAHKTRGGVSGMLAAYRACADNPDEDIHVLPITSSTTAEPASDVASPFGQKGPSVGIGRLISNFGRRLSSGVAEMFLGRKSDRDRAGVSGYQQGYRPPPPPAGCIVAYSRRPKKCELDYMYSARPSLFGTTLVMSPVSPLLGRVLTRREFYEDVWRRHARLFDAKAREEWEAKVAQGTFPFVLRWADAGGVLCGLCSWERFCVGCAIPSDDTPFLLPTPAPASRDGTADASGSGSGSGSDPRTNQSTAFVAIDWEPPLLHLHYDSEGERIVTEHASVLAIRAEQKEAISLEECLASFTKEEELGDDELWRCSKCNDFRKATKKMEIWRLPQILIIHLKRFQYATGRWVKSQKLIRFPAEGLDPSRFVVGPESPSYVPSKPVLGETAAHDGVREDVDGGVRAANGADVRREEGADDSAIAQEPTAVSAETADVSVVHPGEATTSAAAAAAAAVTGKESTAIGSHGSAVCTSTEASLCDSSLGTLDVGQQRQPPLFDLYAVTSHVGVMGGGHYVGYARNPNSKWYCFNDSKCEELKGGGDDLPLASAYVLFYERRGLDAKSLLPKFAADAKEIGLESGDDAAAGGRRRDVCCAM